MWRVLVIVLEEWEKRDWRPAVGPSSCSSSCACGVPAEGTSGKGSCNYRWKCSQAASW